jgi:hypothetical protein
MEHLPAFWPDDLDILRYRLSGHIFASWLSIINDQAGFGNPKPIGGTAFHGPYAAAKC